VYEYESNDLTFYLLDLKLSIGAVGFYKNN